MKYVAIDAAAATAHNAIAAGCRSSRRANNAIATNTQSNIPFAYEYVAIRQHNAAIPPSMRGLDSFGEINFAIGHR